MRLVLASASPRRAELLAAAGFTFDTLVVAIDEGLRLGELPRDYVRRLSMEKSAAALRVLEGGTGRVTSTSGTGLLTRTSKKPVPKVPLVVLGADTAVVIDGEILGKPRDDDDA